MMNFIATDDSGAVVGKWRQHNRPTIPDDFSVKAVDDVDDYVVDYWYNEQS